MMSRNNAPTASYDDLHGSGILDVDGGVLHYTSLDRNNARRDEFGIVKKSYDFLVVPDANPGSHPIAAVAIDCIDGVTDQVVGFGATNSGIAAAPWQEFPFLWTTPSDFGSTRFHIGNNPSGLWPCLDGHGIGNDDVFWGARALAVSSGMYGGSFNWWSLPVQTAVRWDTSLNAFPVGPNTCAMPPGDNYSEMRGVRDGVTVGYSDDMEFARRGGESGWLVTLPGLNSSPFAPHNIANAVNLGLQAVGVSRNNNNQLRAVLWQADTTLVNLGTFAMNGGDSEALAINDAGVVVGYARTNGVKHAVKWELVNSVYQMKDLGVLPGGTYSVACGINNKGHIVGYTGISVPGSTAVASAWINGVYFDLNKVALNTFGLVMARAYAISECGKIVGSTFWQDSGTGQHYPPAYPPGNTANAYVLSPQSLAD
jgi:probable HAF family extracellular repeat protein